MMARRVTNRTTNLQTPPRHRRPVDRSQRWYRIENAASTAEATIYIYDEIGLWGVTAAEFVHELESLQAISIEVHINSPGGDVFDGIAIYNALCNHPATVTTYIDGLAASAASFIAQAGGRVLIARNATMMIHDAEGICMGNAATMREMADLLDRTSDNIADIYAQRCSTVRQWRKAMQETSWYTGQEAVDIGLADEVYEPEPGSDNQPAERRRRAAAPPSARADRAPQSDIPESEHDAIRAHLNSHLDDAPEDRAPMPDQPLPSAWSGDLLRTAMTGGARAALEPHWDPDAFRLAMSTAANNAPAAPERAPAAPILPPLPPPELAVCHGCRRPVDTSSVLSHDTVRAIMYDVVTNVPALPDASPAAPDLGPAIPLFDRAAFDTAIRRGLL